MDRQIQSQTSSTPNKRGRKAIPRDVNGNELYKGTAIKVPQIMTDECDNLISNPVPTYSTTQVNPNKQLKCFWCRNYPENDSLTIGCPVNFHHEYKQIEVTSKLNKTLTLFNQDVEHGYYETDGVFCSFNCCLAFIEDNKHKFIYSKSEHFLKKIYYDYQVSIEKKKKESSGENNVNIDISDIPELLPAPHWRLLDEYGGDLNIQTFRLTFNVVKYDNNFKLSVKCPSTKSLSAKFSKKIFL